MAAANLVNLENSGYICQSTRNLGSRRIDRYILEDSRTVEKVDRAADAIVGLLRDNPHLCPVFAIEPRAALTQIVERNPYLIINGEAVCLSSEPQAPGTVPPQYVDYFSEAVLEHPVLCSANHSLERRFIEQWAIKHPDRCPRGKHLVDPSNVDPVLQDQVDRFREARREEAKEQRKRDEKIKEALQGEQRALALHVQTQHSLAEYRKKRGIEIVSGAAKISTEVMGYVILNGVQFGDKTLVQGACAVCCETFKYLPVVASFINLGLAIKHFNNGEYVRGGAEAASAALNCFPGPGPLVALTMDLAMMGLDIYETHQGKVHVDVDIDKAHEILQLKRDPNHPPTRDEIDAAWRKLSPAVHPDKLQFLGEDYREKGNDLQAWLNGLRDLLLSHYKHTSQSSPPRKKARTDC